MNTQEPKRKPLEVIEDFFDAFELESSQQYIADLLHVAITTENEEFKEALQRANVVSFSGKLKNLIDAAHAIMTKGKK